MSHRDLVCALLCLVRCAGADSITGPVIGIDLGTTYSCVGIFKNRRVEIIPNDQGNRITPSYVAFSGDERLIGEAAKNHASVQPSQTLYDVKRLIGRRFADDTVQKDLATLPYKIVDNNGLPAINVVVKETEKSFTPEEISAMVLGKMKETAEMHLGESVRNAVITVPAYFTDAQRQATKNAGTIAGLDVLRIINEPTAAAIAYGLDKKEENNVLVYDLGGGTFDVSLLTIDNGVFEVLSTSGDTHLGGEDFDQRIMDHFIEIFKSKRGTDITGDKRALQKLKREVEKAKRTLSTTSEAHIDIEFLSAGLDVSEKLSRAKFEELNNDLFRKTIGPMKKVLEDANMAKSKVDVIVLVGGSTRIPKIQKMVEEFFNGKQVVRGVNPDEAVAYGAAVQAGVLGGEEGKDLLLLDITPLSLGIDTTGLMSKIIPRNTVIPTKKTQTYMTSAPNTKTTNIIVFEGERPLTKDNHLLGSFELSGFPPGKEGQKHDVTFEIDVNGILTVSAEVKATSKTESLTIQNSQSRLSEEDIARMIQEAEDFTEEDKLAAARGSARASLTVYLGGVRAFMDDDGVSASMIGEEREKINIALKDCDDWLAQNPDAEVDDVEAKKKEVEELCGPIVLNHVSAPVYDDDDEFEFDEL